MMNNSAMRIEWDGNDRKQVEEAKTHYRNARKEGRKITDIGGNNIDNFRPSLLGFIIEETELSENEFAVRVFDETGDRRLIWNLADPDQVKEAANLFKEYIAKGWRAYATDNLTGKIRRRIYEFNPERQEIFFHDKSVEQITKDFIAAVSKEKKEEKPKLKSESLANFVKSFKNTKLVPRTYPG